MDKYLIIKKTGKGSGHNEKGNKHKTLAQFEEKHPTAATDSSVKVASRFLVVTAGF
jgi:hypothetical protein